MLQAELEKKKARITKFNNELDYLDDQISELLKESTKLGLQLSTAEENADTEKQRQKIKNIKETVEGMKQNRREFKEMIDGLEREVATAAITDPKPAFAKLDVSSLSKGQNSGPHSPAVRSQISVVASQSPSVIAAQNALNEVEDSLDDLHIDGPQKVKNYVPGTDSSMNIKASRASQADVSSQYSGHSKVTPNAITGIGQIANRKIVERSPDHSSLHSAVSESKEEHQNTGIGQAGVRNIVTVDPTAPRQKRDLVQTGIGKVPDWIKKKQEEKEKAKLSGK